MDQRKLEELYNLVLYDYVLNDKLLLSKGFTKEDIDLFIQKRYIIESEPNRYEIYNADRFHKHGIKLLREGKGKEANICFKKCHKLNPTGKRINLQMLLAAVKREDYEEAFKLYRNLEDGTDEKHRLDNNLYLYLLNIITNLPEEYAEKARDFKYEDLAYKKEVISKDENKIRVAIYKNKLSYAAKLLKELMLKKQDEYSIKYELLKELLFKIVSSEKDLKNKILELTKNEEYEEIVKILTEISNIKKLNKVEIYSLLVSYAIVNILKTKTIPKKTVNITYDMYAALMGNNFKLAWELNLDHHTLIETNPNEDPVNLLLKKILELINSLETLNQTTNQSITESSDLTELDKKIKDSEELAYYIKSENLSPKAGIKKLGLKKEQVAMVKLVYIRDYYMEGNKELADNLLKEIEEKEVLTPSIISFINKIKEYRETNPILVTTCHTKKRKL